MRAARASLSARGLQPQVLRSQQKVAGLQIGAGADAKEVREIGGIRRDLVQPCHQAKRLETRRRSVQAARGRRYGRTFSLDVRVPLILHRCVLPESGTARSAADYSPFGTQVNASGRSGPFGR